MCDMKSFNKTDTLINLKSSIPLLERIIKLAVKVRCSENATRTTSMIVIVCVSLEKLIHVVSLYCFSHLHVHFVMRR